MATNKFPKSGTEAYSLGPGAVAKPIKGRSVPKKGGVGAADPGSGTATYRRGVAQGALGAQYRVTASRAPYDETYPSTLANGRIMPPRYGTNRNFGAGQSDY